MLLTHDMQKAAEAAYHGKPKNPNWTRQAQAVYDGMWEARHGTRPPTPTAPAGAPVQNGTHFGDASPLVAKALQAWHIHYEDTGEDVLMLFPAQSDMRFVLYIVKDLAGHRPFRMQALKQGHFKIQLPCPQTIAQLYASDSRSIDQDGMVRLRPLPPPPQARS